MTRKVAFVVLVVVPTASIYPRKRLPRPLRRRLRDVPVAGKRRAREFALVVREEFQGRDRARVLVGHDEADDACAEYGCQRRGKRGKDAENMPNMAARPFCSSTRRPRLRLASSQFFMLLMGSHKEYFLAGGSKKTVPPLPPVM